MPPPTKRGSQPQNKLPTLQEATNEISTKAASFLALNTEAAGKEASETSKGKESTILTGHPQGIAVTSIIFPTFFQISPKIHCYKQ